MHLMHFVSEDIIDRILLMQEVGFNASEQDSLPVLFKEVYGFPLGKCPDCRVSAFNSLVKWANKKKQKPKSTSMALTIKKEYHGKNFNFRHQGKVVVVNHQNINEERARMMLASPYAHAIEGQPDKVEVDLPVVTKQSDLVKKKKDTTASISKEAEKDGPDLVKAVKGKLTKLKGSKQLKGKVGKEKK